MTLLAIAVMAGPGFVRVPAGEYLVGSKERTTNPPRKVTLKSFEIGAFEVTNDEFAAFVAATGYVTDAERKHDAMTFAPGLKEFRWIQDKTASWRWPNGRGRVGIEKMGNHPVTTVSYRDAEAYCKWAGVRLPTLEEWEAACRAGTDSRYFFGEDGSRIGEFANVWHGRDHMSADHSDGFMTTSPVGSFKPNPWGLFDTYGNVFEFCSGLLPGEKAGTRVHARGGSWWCSQASCSFFNSIDVGKVDRSASFSNQGFRIARD